MLSALTTLTTLSLISLNVPGTALKINSLVLVFSQFDILPSDLIYSKVFTFPDEEEAPLTAQFDQLGFNSLSSV
jgi:hypothetical protein